MNRDERRRQKKTAPLKKDGSIGESARRQTVTRASTEGAEESKQDPYRDEGGES
jgi:hypothetical protein